MKIKGIIDTRQIFVDGTELSPVPSQNIVNHSPDGFNWGYGGSGPSQLALALMLLVLNPEKALSVYQQFKWEVIAKLPQDDFEKEIDLEKYKTITGKELPCKLSGKKNFQEPTGRK